MSVLRRAYVEVEPDVSNFDSRLKAGLARQDPGGKAGKQVGGQLNRALSRLNIDPINIKADPKAALAGIAAAEFRLRELAGSAATVEVKIETERALSQLGRFRKQIGDVTQDAGPEAAAGFAAKFSAKLGPLLASMPISGPVGTAAAAAGAAAAPLLGAAVAGGIVGGVGLGGVIGGLKLAAKDPRVETAAKDFSGRLGDRLEEAAGSFVDPAIDGIREIDRALDTIDFERVFGKSSGFVAPLTAGAVAAIVDIGDALEELVDNADAPIAAISDGIALIGRSAASGLRLLADNGKEGAAALKTVFALISAGITSTFNLVNVLTELYGIGQKFGVDWGLQVALRLTNGAMERTAFSARRVAGAAGDAGGEIAAAGRQAVAAALSLDGMAAASDRLADRNLSAAEAALRLRDATKGAKDAADGRQRVSVAEEASLLALARATNTSTEAADKQGRTVAEATRAHEGNRKKLIEVAEKMGYTKTEAKKLATQYLATPTGVNTKIEQPGMKFSQSATKKYIGQLDDITEKIRTTVSVEGDKAAYAKLERLLVAQQAASKGISVSAASSAFRKQEAKAFHAGGWTGPGAKMAPAGVVHADEFVVRKESRRKIEASNPGLLDELNATGQLAGYARGGLVMPFPVDASKTKVISLTDALSKVAPSADVGAGGTLPFILNAVRSQFPGMRLISGFRPNSRTLSGRRSLHADNRAGDFPPNRELAQWWDEAYGPRTKEFISPFQQYNRLNGRRHRYTGAVWNQHNFAGGNAHNHIAMAGGGVIGEPVMGTGLRSGNSYSFGERGPETVTPGVGTGGGNTLIININGPVASKKAAEDLILDAYNSLVAKRKIKTP